MSRSKPSITDVLNTVRGAIEVADAAQDAANALASVEDLRRRAEEHTIKAERARTRAGRAWHHWRAGRLNARATDLERGT